MSLDMPLLGSQIPRIESVPPYVRSGGDDAIELASIAGVDLDTWQRRVLYGSLGQTETGRWSAPETGLCIPRQNGKSVIAEIACLSGIYLYGLQIVYTAHLMATSRRVRARIQQLIESSPDLEREVKQIRVSNEEQSIELKSKARIDFVARSGSSARGWSGDMVFMDEAFALADDMIGALMPIMFARPNWQLWYVSSAGKATSHAFRKIRERGINRDPGLAYYEWSVDEQTYRENPTGIAVDPAMWAIANPAYGKRITGETLRVAQRSMDETEFAREVLGVWDDPRGAPLLDPLAWQRLADPGSQITETALVMALDVSPGLESGAIAVAGYRSDELIHVEVTGRDGQLDARPGTDWIVPRVKELQEQWCPAAWIIDPGGPAGALLRELDDAGIEMQTINARELTQASGAFLKAATAPPVTSPLRHLAQLPLTDAVRAAKKRDVGDGGWAFGRRATEQDISPLVAVTLAMYGLSVHGAARYNVLESIH